MMEQVRLMKEMSLQQIASACNGTYVGDDSLLATEVTSVVTDSREVTEGALFIALRGERVDGHRFIPEVFARGAAAVISEEELADPAGPYIRVTSGPQALADIAAYYRGTLSIPIVGITGSVGKTSTKEMIATVLEQKYRVAKTEGNFNNEIGLPLTLLRIRAEHEVAVVEMGISDFGEMHRLARMTRPDICVLTNIGRCHLENLGDRAGVLRAKSEIFDFLEPDGAIVLNGNDDMLATIGDVRGVHPRYYLVCDGTEPVGCGAYFVTADGIENHGLSGMAATLHLPGEDCRIEEPIPGIHNIYNACAAACVGDLLGLTHAEIVSGIKEARTLAGRANRIEAGGFFVLDDCYNANPESMRASLAVLAATEGRRIAVLGDMLELGEDARALHAEVGAYAADCGVDLLFCTGELSEALADAAAAGGLAARHLDTKKELIEQLLSEVRPGDTVLVKASHGMGFDEVVTALTEADRFCSASPE